MKLRRHAMLMATVLIAICWSAAAAENCSAIPLAKDDALVFPPDMAAVLRVKAANPTNADLRLVAEVGEFEGVNVSGKAKKDAEAQGETVVAVGTRKFCVYKLLPGKTVAKGETNVKPGFDGETTIKLGAMPEGFYLVSLTFYKGKDALANRKYPLGVFVMPENKPYVPAPFLIGVYPTLMQYRRTTEPIFWKTYIHAMAHDLAKHHINAVRSCGNFSEGELEIFNRYGIGGISMNGVAIDHPGMIASFISDEPKPGEHFNKVKATFDELSKKTDKVLTTCMIGEGIGLTGPADPVSMWHELKPKVRLFRWYGVKKHFYDALHHIHYKGILPYTSVLRIAEVCDETPWWVIIPAFGGDQHEAYFQNPSPAQLSVLLHLALAYGADGLILFRYQVGMADPVTFKPRDGKLEVAGRVAELAQEHVDMFRSLKHAGLDIRCPTPTVAAIPVKIGEQLAVYAVNMDAENAVNTKLMLWEEVWNWTKAHDVFAKRDIEITKSDDGYLAAPLALEAGEGKLIITDAGAKKKK